MRGGADVSPATTRDRVRARPATYNGRQPRAPMKILISNDDGYQASGIVALYEALKDVADVEVMAPEQNNSAKSNACLLYTSPSPRD